MKTDYLYLGHYVFEDEQGYFYNHRYWGKQYIEKDIVLKLNK